MRNKLHLLVCIAVLSALPLWAAKSDKKSTDIEQRLRDTDLSLTLRQYERVQMKAFETKLKLDLLSTDPELNQEARKKQTELLERRIAILADRADQLRHTALKLGEEINVAKVK